MDIIEFLGPPGIGDNIWHLMKSIDSIGSKKINLKVCDRPNYSSWFLSKLDKINSVEATEYKYSDLIFTAANYYPLYNEQGWQETNYVEPNKFLESGCRIETYFPKLETNWKLKWNLDNSLCINAKSDYIKSDMKNIVFLTSSLSNNCCDDTDKKNLVPRWEKLLQNIYDSFEKVNLIWIGGHFDTDFMNHLKPMFPEMKFAYNESPDVVLTILRNCQAFISYNSGMAVITVCEEIPTYLFYPRWITDLRYSWCPPNSINNRDLYTVKFFDEFLEDQEITNVLNWIKVNTN